MNARSRPAPSTTFVEDYAVAARRFAAAVGHTDLKAPVAGCPGWTGHDVVVHLGNVHAWAATVVETGRRAPTQGDRPRSHRSRAVEQWYVAKAEDLYQVLRHTPAASACWTLTSEVGDALFWQRRQLHETVLHLVDLDLSAGRTTEIGEVLAADGVDEVLTVMLARMHARGRVAALTAPLRLTASDTGDSWILTPGPLSPPLRQTRLQPQLPAQRSAARGPLPVVRRFRPGDPGPEAEDLGLDRITAPAELLYRLLWHRADPAEVSGFGLHGDSDRVLGFLGSALVP